MDKPRDVRRVVCRRDDLNPGEIRSFEAGRRRIAVMRLEDGTFRAMADGCPHEGASMGKGTVESMWTADEVGQHRPSGDRVVAVCPWHNFEFDVNTGLTPNVSPRLRVKTYPTQLEGEEVAVYGL